MLQMCRLFTLAIFSLTIAALVGTGSGLAATLTVTNTNDSGTGSLRDAITKASPGDTIQFNLTYPAEIDLSSPLSLTRSVTISGPGVSNLLIVATGAGEAFSVTAGVTAAVSGMEISSISGGNVAGIYNAGNLTVTATMLDSFDGGGMYNNGTLTIRSSTISGNSGAKTAVGGSGGGIYNDSGGTLNVANSTLSSNVAHFVSPYPGLGGGIYNNGGKVIVSSSTLSGNNATSGGGLYNNGGTVVVSNSTVSDNRAGPEGGAISNIGTLIISNSTLSRNGASHGGGIYNNGTTIVNNCTVSDGSGVLGGGGIYNDSGGAVNMVNSTLSGNAQVVDGGGIYNAGNIRISSSTVSDNHASHTGGIYNNGTATVSNSTISGNTVYHAHIGGIFNDSGGTLNLTNCTLFGNYTFGGIEGVGAISNIGTLIIKNTIVANSFPGITPPLGSVETNCFGTASTSAGHNLSDDASCYFAAVGDRNNTPSGLDPSGLQNNGGPTQTIALLATSPAVDAVPVSPVNYCTATDGITPITTDERGIPRPQGLACDIGAYEFLAAITAPAPTSGTTCNGVYNGTFNGNIKVSAGQACIFFNGGVTGNVQQDGGSLVLFQSKVGNNVQVNGGGTFAIGPGSTIGGNLQIKNLPIGLGESQVCGTMVQGDLQFQNDGTSVLIGAVAPAACPGNAIAGNLQVQNNSASTTIEGNTVTGNLQDQNNTGLTQVFFNSISNNLQCQNNTAIEGVGNTALQKQGQCVGF